MNPSAYNNNMQVFQTPEYVVILNEMVHDSRIIPLDGRSHLPPGIRQWMGDSRGHWKGGSPVSFCESALKQNLFRQWQRLSLRRRPRNVGLPIGFRWAG